MASCPESESKNATFFTSYCALICFLTCSPPAATVKSLPPVELLHSEGSQIPPPSTVHHNVMSTVIKGRRGTLIFSIKSPKDLFFPQQKTKKSPIMPIEAAFQFGERVRMLLFVAHLKGSASRSGTQPIHERFLRLFASTCQCGCETRCIVRIDQHLKKKPLKYLYYLVILTFSTYILMGNFSSPRNSPITLH